jgi:hypothetical protein
MYEPWLISSLHTYGVYIVAIEKQLYHSINVDKVVQLEAILLEISPTTFLNFITNRGLAEPVAAYREDSGVALCRP